jgi:hypothetical protein
MGIPVLFTFYLANDQILQWGPLVTGITANLPSPTYVNDAAGTITLYDPTGNAVDGFDSISLDYVAASNGIYRAQITGFDADPGQGYLLFVELSAPTAGNASWRLPAAVALRTGQ